MAIKYSALNRDTDCKILKEAYKLLGTKELLGKDSNPVIIGWAREVGLERDYNSDDIPWCGLFMAYVCHKAGKPVVQQPLWAKNWLKFGVAQKVAMRGDVLVFNRKGGGGHVGIYLAEDETCYHVLGGNQGDQVSIVRIPKARCVGIRRTDWSKSQPENVRPVLVDSKGEISINEA